MVARWFSIGLMVAAAGCGTTSSPSTSAPTTRSSRDGEVVIPDGSPLRSGLVFDTVRASLRSDVVIATASVESDPAHTVRVLPPMAGRVVALHVRLGDVVHVGEPLLTLDSPDFTSSQADYAHALTAFRQARNTVTRQRDLAQYGIAAPRDVEGPRPTTRRPKATCGVPWRIWRSSASTPARRCGTRRS
jgi:cobalt-zinc-cadmium efflux system membrane fusion protein